MNFDYEIFCKNVQELRKIKKFNKYEMAIQSNIQYQYYCDIENGKSPPNFKAVIAIANALNTNITQLLSDTYSTENECLKADVLSMIQTISNRDILEKYLKFIIFLKTRKETTVDGI